MVCNHEFDGKESQSRPHFGTRKFFRLEYKTTRTAKFIVNSPERKSSRNFLTLKVIRLRIVTLVYRNSNRNFFEYYAVFISLENTILVSDFNSNTIANSMKTQPIN